MTIHSYRQDDNKEIRGEISAFKGRQYISIRAWYRDAAGAWLPSRNGINVPLEEARDLARLVAQLLPSYIEDAIYEAADSITEGQQPPEGT